VKGKHGSNNETKCLIIHLALHVHCLILHRVDLLTASMADTCKADDSPETNCLKLFSLLEPQAKCKPRKDRNPPQIFIYLFARSEFRCFWPTLRAINEIDFNWVCGSDWSAFLFLMSVSRRFDLASLTGSIYFFPPLHALGAIKSVPQAIREYLHKISRVPTNLISHWRTQLDNAKQHCLQPRVNRVRS
jgi:hypothetical protein